MEICNRILYSYAMFCRKEMVKILKCYLFPKKSYGTLSKAAIFFGQPCIYILINGFRKCYIYIYTVYSVLGTAYEKCFKNII